MKALIGADLHGMEKWSRSHELFMRAVRYCQPDAIVLLGDVFESNVHARSAVKTLNKISDGIPLMYVFGNHEFWFKSPEQVEDEFRQAMAERGSPSVHILDIENYADVGDYRFVGNVLFYDGTMSTEPGQDLNDFAHGTWQDRLIKGSDSMRFDWRAECEARKKRILDSLSDTKKNVLCTHCVPHDSMNMHMLKSRHGMGNLYNAFSGSSVFMDALKGRLAYAFSGHTHLPARNEVDGCKMFNVGNEYLFYQRDDKMVTLLIELDSGEVLPSDPRTWGALSREL